MTTDQWIDLLKKIADAAAKREIVWGVGASSVLFERGIVGAVNDLDLVTTLEYAPLFNEALSSMGEVLTKDDNPMYKTAFFKAYLIEGLEVDLMAGFTISSEAGDYTYHFDRESIDHIAVFEGTNVPFTSLEDWYVLYQLMGRDAKSKMIEDHFHANGLERPDILNSALRQNLPDKVRQRIEHMFANRDIAMPAL